MPSTGVIAPKSSGSLTPMQPSDPLASLPSSPPQIYLNLLILEASLRAQFLELRARKRQHTFFLALLALWILFFGHALFFAPREDGSGVGGSVYWVVEVTEKLAFMGGIVTGMLIWGTGQWERGIRWPRRWVGHSNRGLRGFNCKLVVIKRPWWREVLSTVRFILSTELFSPAGSSTYRFVNNTTLATSEKTAKGSHTLPNIHEDGKLGHEEDLAPGGDYVKLLLLPKPFSPAFRENWDVYRTEYWEKENERRAALSAKLKIHDKQLAKQRGGWLWWSGWRGWRRNKGHGDRGGDVEKTHLHHRISEKDLRRQRSGSLLRSGSHSRNSSRSSTPAGDLEDQAASAPGRRGSNTSIVSERRKKKGSSSPRTKVSPAVSRSSTPTVPEVHSPLVRNNSHTSISSLESERPITPALNDGDSIRSMRIGARPGGNARKPLTSKTFEP